MADIGKVQMETSQDDLMHNPANATKRNGRGPSADPATTMTATIGHHVPHQKTKETWCTSRFTSIVYSTDPRPDRNLMGVVPMQGHLTAIFFLDASAAGQICMKSLVRF